MPKLNDIGQKSRLIAAIRAHKLLYDPTHPSYSDFEARSKVWGEIAAQCDIKRVQTAKSMWKQMRDGYRMYRKKPDQKNNSYMCYKLMKFIDPHLIQRKTSGKSSVPVFTENNDTEAKSNDETKANSNTETKASSNNDRKAISNEDLNACESLEPDGNTTAEFTTIQYWNDAEDISEKFAEDIPTGMAEEISQKLAADISRQFSEDISPKFVEEIPQQFTELGRNNGAIIPTNESLQDSNSASEIESYEDVLPEALKNGTVDKSLKMFFDAMYASASQLPQRLQRFVKKNIFSTILEAEEQFEKEQKLAAESQASHFVIKREL